MGEILGLGLSHYPGPVTPPKHWSRMISRNVEVGRIKPELFADKASWPKGMLAEWSNDEGLAAAEEHRRRLLAGYKVLGEALNAFKPDLVLIWGDDQFENYKKTCVPAFALGIFDEVDVRPFGGGKQVFQTTDNVWNLEPETPLKIRGHRKAAAALARHLIEDQFDIAYSLEFQHKSGLAHSFNNTVLYLDYDNHGEKFGYPVIPMHVNCYGSDLMKTAAGMIGEGEDVLSPPAPTPRRCFDIGRSVARFFAASPWRVALIGSSSWSHGSLTKKHGRLYPDLDADRKRHDELQNGDFRNWGNLTEAEIDDTGQHELLNWIALAGAMTELDRSVDIVDFVPSYIFNSSKCFAIFPPAGVQLSKDRALAASAPA
jgi:hypothetical protein